MSIGIENHSPTRKEQPRDPEADKRMRHGSRTFLLVLVGRGIQFALALLTLRIASHLLEPAQMGRMAIIMALTAFFALGVINPVGMFLNRKLHNWHNRGVIPQRLRHYRAYLIVVSCLVAICLLLLNRTGLLRDLSAQTSWLIVLVCGSLIFNSLNQTYIPSLNLLGHRLSFISLTIATLLFGLGSSVLLVHIFRASAELWLLGILVGQLIVGLIGGRVFSSRIRHSDLGTTANLSGTQLRTLFFFAWPLSLSVVLNWLQFQSYRFLIGKIFGVEQLGMFIGGFSIGVGIVVALEQVLTTQFQPLFYHEINSSPAELHAAAWNTYSRAIFPAVIVTVWFVYAAAPELTRLLLSSKYQMAVKFVFWGALVDSCRVIAGTYGLMAHARMRTLVLLVPNLVGAVCAVSLSLFLSPRYGLWGTALGLAIAGITAIFVSHIVMFQIAKLHVPIKSIAFSFVTGFAIPVAMWIARSLLHDGKLQSSLFALACGGLVYFAIQYLILKSSLDTSKHPELAFFKDTAIPLPRRIP